MTPLYIIAIPETNLVFGVNTNYGHAPAYFTHEEDAAKFQLDHKAIGLLCRISRIQDVELSLEFNENTYVLFDGKPLLVREFKDILSRPS